MGKKKEPDLEERLKQDYEQWEYLREFGGSDPFWDDSSNMNLVRNHIIYGKREIAESMGRIMRNTQKSFLGNFHRKSIAAIWPARPRSGIRRQRHWISICLM